MAKKEATKAAAPTETKAEQPAPKQMNVLTLKHWATGTINQTGEPVLMLESTEGPNIGFRLSGQSAVDIGKALVALGEQHLEAKAKAN
jgi:hypothetical protein